MQQSKLMAVGNTTNSNSIYHRILNRTDLDIAISAVAACRLPMK